MKFVREHVETFAELFRGNQNSHGVHIPEKNPVEGEKAEGKSFTRNQKITHNHLLKHLHGEESIGVSPLDDNGNIRFAVIDVDEYPLKPVKFLKLAKATGIPFVGFRSKSGGLHLYLFFSQDTPASSALPIVRLLRQLFSLKADTEIFPKQTRLVGAGAGNWINLPYFKCKESARYAYSYDGQELSLKDALVLMMSSKTTLSELKTILEALPMAQAPPCLQTIYLAGGASEGSRNVYLFNCATYMKARFGEDFAENLHLLNSKMELPVEYEELDRTIIASHNKGDYSYQCQDAILAVFCDKDLCGQRKYGKGAGAVSDLSFEQLIQVQSATPYYKWFINGAEMIFFSESDLMNQQKFREMCLRLLHKVPNRLKDTAWNNVLNRALTNLKVETVEADDDLSEDSLWLSKITEFFTRRQAMRPSQVEEGLVWLADDNKLHFKGAKLLEYLDKSGLFRHFQKAQHRNLLKLLGSKPTKLRYTDLQKSGRTWCLDLKDLHEKGLFVEIATMDEEFEKELTPLDFIGEEKF